MKLLNKNWLTEHNLDFEYKKYVLLAYLKSVEHEFELQKLYPALNDLVEHYRNVILIKENSEQLNKKLNSNIKKIDLNRLKFIYDEIERNKGLLKELEEIIDYSIPQFKKHIEEGKKIYEFIEKQIFIEPLGLISLKNDEGYMFLHYMDAPKTQVYQYHITIFDQPDEKYRAINTTFIKEFDLGISSTFQSIKSNLLKERNQLPNASAYLIESEYSFPISETFLPIAKRMLVKFTANL
jgi:hypothetical protein